MKIEKMLGIVIVLQVVILAGQWLGQPAASTARAEIFNPGERQLAILEEAKGANARLDKLLSYLQSGDLQVKVAKDDEKK